MSSFSWLTVSGDPLTVLAEFVGVDGEPLKPRREYKIIRRPGVDNHGKYRKGYTCPQYTLTTEVDAADLTAALALQVALEALEGTVADLYWQGHFWSGVDILLAEPKTVHVNHGAAGGLVAGGAIAVMKWDLIGLA